MLTILLYTAIFIIVSVALGKFMVIAFAPEQMFDILFGWQKILDKLYGSKYTGLKLLEKVLGGCNLCVYHFASIISFVMYAIFLNKVIGLWVTDYVHGWFWSIVVNFIWYILFVTLSWFLSIKINYEKEEKG